MTQKLSDKRISYKCIVIMSKKVKELYLLISLCINKFNTDKKNTCNNLPVNIVINVEIWHFLLTIIPAINKVQIFII